MTGSKFTWFRRSTEIPNEHRANFRHLYFDIGWFGVLNGSAVAFMAVFATRLGASSLEIGLLNAVPAVVNLLVTLPVGGYLQHRKLSRAVFWASIWHRSGYLLWIFLPIFLMPQQQVWGLILLILLMSVPGTMLSVGFNAMLAAAVPSDWRGHVVGWRNAVFALSSIGTLLLSGAILDWLPFPLGYQVVFFFGFIGAAMSSLHLFFIRPLAEREAAAGHVRQRLSDMARPGFLQIFGTSRPMVALRGIVHFDLIRGRLHLTTRSASFRRVLGLLFLFHFAQYFGIPLYPQFFVRGLDLSDQVISIGSGLFYLSLFLLSTQISWLSRRFGNHRVTTIGAATYAIYPLVLGTSAGAAGFLVASALGGLAWALAGGALGNYLLERIPETDRPPYLAWYNLSLHLAILSGSLLGPALANRVGLVAALMVTAAARLVAAVLIGVYGRGHEEESSGRIREDVGDSRGES